MNSENLEHIIKQCKANKREGQHHLFNLYKDTLYRLSLKYCRNKEDAEDNVHDTFMTIFQNIKKYKGKGSFEGWIKRITIYKAIDRYKQQKEFAKDHTHKIPQEDTHIDTRYAEVQLDIVLKFVQELPDQYRLVFNLYQLDGYKHQEIATLLSISEGTSKSNYHRAKLLLKEKIMSYSQKSSKKPRSL